MLGQIIVRKTGTIINGKEAVIIAGIVALNPEEDEKLKSEHQYIVTGMDIYSAYEKDLTDELCGKSIDGALTEPIWRL